MRVFQHANTKHPIVDLLKLRGDPNFILPKGVPEFRKSVLFEQLPHLSLKQISKFGSELEKTRSLQKALSVLSFRMEYSRDFVTDFLRDFEVATIPEEYQIHILYQCIAWLVKDKDLVTISAELPEVLLGLNRLCDSTFAEFCGEILESLFRISIETELFKHSETIVVLFIQHICINRRLSGKYRNMLVEIIEMIIESGQNALLEKNLSLIVLLFEQKSPIVEFKSFTHFLSVLTEFFNSLNPNALLIAAYASQMSKEAIISDSFIVLPTLIFNQFEEMEIVLKLEHVESVESEVNDDELFDIPQESIIVSDGDIKALCHGRIRTMASQINIILGIAGVEAIKSFTSSFSNIEIVLKESVHSADFILMVSLLLDELSHKASIKPLLSLLFAGSLFSEKDSVFSASGISEDLNLIRNSIIDTVASIDQELFHDVLEIVSDNLFRFAELIMRLSYRFGNGFFAKIEFLKILVEALGRFQRESNSVEMNHTRKAKSVLFSILFTLLGEHTVAMPCFSAPEFCEDFVELISAPRYSAVVIDAFVNCVLKFEEIPDSIVHFFSMMFKKCSGESNETSCKLGIRMIKGIIQILSHNPTFGNAFAPVFESVLAFARGSSEKESLELTMSLLTFITQSNKVLELSDSMFNDLLDFRQQIEGDDPSDGFLLSCLNVMNASTNLSIDLVFPIEIPNIIPMLICSCANSSKITYVIDIFQRLCLFSVKNIIACYQSGLCTILLKGIKGEFELFNRKINFPFGKDGIDAALRLISTIVSERSSIEIDRAILDIFNNDNIEVSRQVLETLHNIFINHEKNNHEIWSPEPIYTVEGVPGDQLSNGFAFSCYMKIDAPAVAQRDYTFVFLRIESATDPKKFIEVVHQQEAIVCRYESGSVRTTAALLEKLPSNKWILVTTFLCVYEDDDETVVSFRFDDAATEEIIFRGIKFDKNVKVTLGRTLKRTIPPESFSPVAMGKFAFFLMPFEDSDFVTLHANGFNELSNFANVAFTSFSDNCFMNKSACRKDMSIVSLMPHHARIADFGGIFANPKCHESPLFIEIAIETLIQCTDFHNSCNSGKAFISLIEESNQDPFPFLTEITGIPDEFFQGYNCASSPFKFSMHLSEISTIISYILRSKQFRIDSNTFPAFLEMIESTHDEELVLEILENVVVNIWLWIGNTTHYLKISRQLVNYLAQFAFPSKGELFSECLVQAHLFQNYSTIAFPSFEPIKLKLLELLPLTPLEVPCFISVICATRDLEQLTGYLNILQKKEVMMTLELLVELINVTQFAELEQVKQVLDIIIFSTRDVPKELKICQMQLALKCKDMEIFNLIEPELDIFCIEALRTSSSAKLLNYIKTSYMPEWTPFWYFWPMIAAMYTDESLLDFIIKNVIFLGVNYISSNFTRILNLLALLRATRAFKGVAVATKKFICQVLDYAIEHQEEIGHEKIRQMIMRSFASVFYKLKLCSHSGGLLREWMKSPFWDGNHTVDPRQDLKHEFSYENLQVIFGRYLDDMQYRFWRSHSKKSDADILRRIYLLSQHQAFADDPKITMLRSYIVNESATRNAYNVFTFFSCSNDSVDVLTAQVKIALREITLYLNPNLMFNFDQKEILVNYYNTERLRLKRLYNSVEMHAITKKTLSSRFVRFPIQFPKDVHQWSQNTDDTFTLVKGLVNQEKVKLLFSAPCKMITILGRINCTFALLSNEIRISQIGKPVMSIRFESIHCVMAVRPKIIELYTSACESVLLSFSPELSRSVAMHLTDLSLQVVTDARHASSRIIDRWGIGRVSNFDLILALNFIIGRSFNDIYAYPMMPVVTDNKFLSPLQRVDSKQFMAAVSRWLFSLNLIRSEELPMPNVNIDEEIARAAADPGCVAPQLYFSFYSFDPAIHKMIYESRKVIDSSPEIEKAIRVWIERQFGASLPTKDIFHKKIDNIVQYSIRSNKTIKYSRFYGAPVDVFFAYFDDDTVEVLFMNMGSVIPALSTIKKLSEKFNLSDCHHFCALESVLLIIDVKYCMTYRIDNHGACEKFITSLQITQVSPFGNSIVYVIDHNLVMISSSSEFPLKQRAICTESERIVLLETSIPYSIVIYVTESGVMRIVSVATSGLLGCVKFDDEKVEKLLVTRYLGFIIVKTNKHLYTYSIDGSLLSQIDHTSRIVDWIPHCTKGIDYVILLDEDMRISYYEAFYPESLKSVTRLKKRILAMRASRQRSALILIADDGNAVLLPFPF